MNYKKIYRLMSVICWIGTAISGVLLFYLLRTAEKVSHAENLTGSIRLTGVLMLVWLMVSVFFTVRAYLFGKNEKK